MRRAFSLLCVGLWACGGASSDELGLQQGAAGAAGAGGGAAGTHAAGSSAKAGAAGASANAGAAGVGAKAGAGAAGASGQGGAKAGASGSAGAGQGGGGAKAGAGGAGQGGAGGAGQAGAGGAKAGAGGGLAGQSGASGAGQAGAGGAGAGQAGAGGAGQAGAGGAGQAGAGGAGQAGAGGAGQAGAGGAGQAGAGGAGQAGAGQAGAGGSVQPKCGNGVAEAGEECDDANGNDGDGCRNDCTVDCGRFKGGKKDPVSSHCYWVHEGLIGDGTWSQAVKTCKDDGGHLVIIDSAQENAFVDVLHDQTHWIGASDGRDLKSPGAGTYAWVDGAPLAYANWAPNEPNASESGCGWWEKCFEHCATKTKSGQWDDRRCDAEFDYVCEWDPPGY